MSFEVAATAIPVVQSGKMRALAVTCPKRLAQLPDTPIFAEAGIHGFVLEGLALVAAHGKTPPDIVKRLNEAMVKIIDSPKVRDKIAGMGLQARSSSPDEARAMLSGGRQALGRGGEGGGDSAAGLGLYCSACFTFSNPALAHSSSLPGEPATPTPRDNLVAELDRHAAVERGDIRQQGLVAPRRPRRHFLREFRGGDAEGARGVGLAARGLHGVRPGVVVLECDHGVASAVDHHRGSSW